MHEELVSTTSEGDWRGEMPTEGATWLRVTSPEFFQDTVKNFPHHTGLGTIPKNMEFQAQQQQQYL